MHFRIYLFVLISISELQAKPFLLSVPRALSNFISSASSSASSYVFSAPLSSAEPAISDLRQRQTKDDDDDDFFKDEPGFFAQNATTAAPLPNLLQLKIGKILEKVRILSELSSPAASGPSSDDDFQKEQDEFDKEFEEDANKDGNEDMKSSASLKSDGYFYPKPANPLDVSGRATKKSEKLSDTRFGFNPGSFGIFLMEIVGSLVGLAYGAAAQLNAPSSVTNPP